MLKVSFKIIGLLPESKLSVYNSIDRIPFSLRIGKYLELPETIYARNLCGENFVEFRFDSNNKHLYEVALVAIQPNTVIDVESMALENLDEYFYRCYLEDESVLQFSTSMKIYRNSNTIKINWGFDEKPTKYYSLTKNCLVGVDNENFLTSIVLRSISEEELFNIFGF